MTVPKPMHAQQRAAMARAFLDGLKAFSLAYTGTWRIGDRATDIAIGCAIIMGQAEDKPMSTSDIAG